MTFSLTKRSKGGPLQRRHQIAGAIASISLCLLLIASVGSPENTSIYLLVKTGLYCLIAMTIGFELDRNINKYPGVEATSSLLTAFAISFAMLLGILIVGRLPYSRLLLFASYTVVALWSMAIHLATSRRRKLTIGIVPGGDHSFTLDVQSVHWIPLKSPDHDTSAVHAVTADLRVDLPPEWDRWLADCALSGIPVYHTKHLVESLTGMVRLEHLSENSFGTLAPISAFMTFKHVIDWLIAAAALVVLAPLLLMLAIVIRFDSPGPAIFRQTRIGYRGEPFTVYKFRTMRTVVPSTSALDAAKTQSDDTRITRIGAFLRRSRIDELPQIVNILKGEMSWIGPRPEARILSEWYEGEIPFYRYRHIVRPGLTGWAQVNQGHVAEVADVRRKLYFDFYYIKNYSPWIDILIALKTVQTILTGFGAK